MATRVSQSEPSLEISFFISGWYTYRNPLFAPFKNIGIQVVSFKEPVIDGLQFELSDKLEWIRRPGFSVFCPIPLPDAEIVNQFYSTRTLSDVVVPWVDTTQRLAIFSDTSITTVLNKTTTAQGYVSTIGNMTYYSDGASADLYKFDGTNLSAWGLAAPTVTPVSSGMGFWQQYTSYGIGDSLLDPNGNVESLSGVVVSNGSFSSPTDYENLPLAGSTSNPWVNEYVQIATVPGYGSYLFLESFNFNIPSTATIVGIELTYLRQVTLASAVDQSIKLVIGGAVVGTDHASGAPWSETGYTSITYGGPTDLWGATPTPAQINANGATGFGVAISGNISAITGAHGGAIFVEGTTYGTNLPVVTVYYTLPSGVPAPGISGENEPIWPTTIGTDVADGGVVWTNYGPIETWYPTTYYPTPVVILDNNGFLQLGASASNVIDPWNSGVTYAAGQIVAYGGSYWTSVFNGSNTGIVPTSGYTVATLAGSVTTTVPYWVETQSPITTGSIAPVWNTTIGGETQDGDYTWTNIGQGTGLAFTGYSYVYGYRTIYGHLTTSSPISDNTGAILGPLNGAITSFSIASNIVTFNGNNNFLPGNVFTVSGLTVGTYLNEESFTVLSAVPSASFPLTSVAVSGSNVLTILAINKLVAGQKVTFSDVSVATFLNGQTVTVLPGGLSGTQFEANFTHATYGATADAGTVNVNGSFTANFTHANVSNTVDAGSAIPLISTVTGVGTGSPLCNASANITAVSISANVVTIMASNNFQPGLWVTIDGLTSASFLNGQQFQVISVDQPIGTLNTYFQIYFEWPNYTQTADAGIATFNAIEIYRTSDGGGIYLFSGAATNPGVNAQWSYNDFVTDADLDILLVAPLDHQNDPPPGAPGSITTPPGAGAFTAYWQGRLWMIVGNYVYFDAGPDCTNGVPEESWPPANRFQYASKPFALVPTADGLGLVVWASDRTYEILGGPETISFYSPDALSNFGILNSNAIFRDGSITGQFTTQKEYFELIGQEKQEIGERIADYLTDNFDPKRSYVTMHRDGLDVGAFISNGVDRIVRYGSNIGAWSVPAFPSFGAGALNSVETSDGVYSLMLGAPTGGTTSILGPLNPGTGASVAGSGTAWLNPSNITSGSATSYTTVTFGAAGSSQILRALNYAVSQIPATAAIQGVQVTVVGKQTAPSASLSLEITPTNAAAGAETHTFSFGTSNTTFVFGGPSDLWGMPWQSPAALLTTPISFDLTATFAGFA